MKHTLSNASNHVTQINFRKKIAATAIATVLSTSLAFANADMQVDVSVPAGSLSKAIVSIAQQYDVTIVAPDALILGLNTTEFADKISLDALFQRLLDGTDLSVVQLDEKIYKVQKIGTDSSTSADGNNDSVLAENVEIIEVRGKFQQSLVDRIPIDISELPFSLDIVDRGLIDERNYTRAIDALTILPSIEIATDDGGFGQPSFIVRGFGAPILVNNRVQTSIRGGGLRDDSFVERYEVLRGPASIALGPVDGGAVINTVTRSPSIDKFVNTEVNVDDFGTLELELDYNHGALDKDEIFTFRTSGAYRDIGFDADEVKREVFAIRPVIEASLSENTSAQLSAAFVDMDLKVNWGFPLYNDGTIPDFFDTDTFFGFENTGKDYSDLYVEGQANHAFLDNLKLTLRGSYQRSEEQYANEGGLYNYSYDDGLPGVSRENPVGYLFSASADIEVKNYFLDAQLAGDFELLGERQDFVIGGSVQDSETIRENVQFITTDFFPITDIELPQISPEPDFSNPLSVFESKNELQSIYGEFAFRPTESISIIGGVRHDELDQNEQDFDNTSIRLGASYNIVEGVNGYLSYAESFSPQFGELAFGGPVGPVTSDSYEVGLKSKLLNGKLRINSAVFRTVRNDVAVQDTISNPGTISNLVIPLGEVESQGFEISSDLEITNNFHLNVNYGYLDIDVVSGEGSIGLLSFADHTASFFASYSFSSGTYEGLKIGGGGRYTGEQPSNLDGFSFPSEFIADAFMSYPLNEKTQIQLNVINFFNERYLEGAGRFFGRLNGISTFGAPRTFRLTIRSSF